MAGPGAGGQASDGDRGLVPLLARACAALLDEETIDGVHRRLAALCRELLRAGAALVVVRRADGALATAACDGPACDGEPRLDALPCAAAAFASDHAFVLGAADSAAASFVAHGLASVLAVRVGRDGPRGALVCGLARDVTEAELAVAEALAVLAASAVARVESNDAERAMRRSLEAVRSAALAVAEEPDLPRVLQRIVEAARAAIGAHMAALGIMGGGEDVPFDPWVESGAGEETWRRLGHAPRPVGTLGFSPRTRGSLRVPDVTKHPDFRGLPPGHPPIGPFLAVPIPARGEPVGTLYLARRPGAPEFIDRDQRVIEMFAQHAAHALDQARVRAKDLDEAQALRRVSEALRTAEERLNRIVDDAPIGMAVIALDGRFERVNRALCEMLGYPPAELAALRFQDVTHPADLQADVALAERLQRGEIPHYALEKRYVRKDGRVVEALLHGTIVRDAEGRPLHYLAQVFDETERRRTLAALRASESSLARAQRIAGLGSWDLDVATGDLRWSAECYRLFGVSPDTFRPTHEGFMQFVHPEEREAVRRAIDDSLYGAKPYWVEHRAILRDGTERLFLEQGEVQRAADGRPLRMTGTVLDVTEKRRAERALRERENLFRNVLELLPVGVWVTDADGGLVLGNEAGRRVWGGARYVGVEQYGEYVGWWPDSGRRIAPDEWALARAVRRGETVLGELVRIRAFDGTEKMILNSALPVRDESGRVMAAIVVNEDVTDRHRSEVERERLVAELSAERRWLRAVIEWSPTGIVLIEGERGERIVANRRAEELMGRSLPPGGGMRQYVGQVCAPDGRPLALEELPGWRALVEGRITEASEQVIQNVNGTRTPVLLSAAPILDESGRRVGAVVLYQDVTLIKQLERLREEWTSVVAHDLRQPVAAIAAAAGIIVRSTKPEQVARWARNILASSARLERMIADLLDVSRIEAHRLVVHPQPLALDRLLSEVVERLGAGLESHAVRVHCERELPEVAVDPERFEQILGNLLSNAAKYGEAGAPILVSAARAGEYLRVSVRNRGPPIPPDRLTKLFARFERIGQGGPGAPPGLGLGLYIARGLVEAHGGRIWAESAPDGWTAFHFTLPHAGHAPASPREPGALLH